MILPIFNVHPKEGKIIGRLLAGYSDLEIGLMTCVMTIRADFDAVFKTMYRIRGETQRIDIADALGRKHFHDVKLGTHFEMAVGSVRHCLKIRNQLAHCAWHSNENGRIIFSNLEEMAKLPETFTSFESLPLRQTDLTLLQAQHTYFEYVDEFFMWLRWEALRHRNSEAQTNPFVLPQEPARPPLYIP